MLAAWGVSYTRNRAFQTALTEASARAEQQFREAGVDLTQVREDDADLRAPSPRSTRCATCRAAMPNGDRRPVAGDDLRPLSGLGSASGRRRRIAMRCAA